MKKRIVHFITSLRRGGAETLLVDLISSLPQYEHTVLYIYDGINRNRLEEIGIKTKQIQPVWFIFDPIFFLRAFLLIKKLSPDVLHTALWSANFIGRLCAYVLRIRCISVIHLGVDQDGKLRNILDKLTFFLSQEVVAVSDTVCQSLVAAKYVPATRIKTILNGVNSNELKRKALQSGITREMLGLDNSHFIIGSVGRFIPRKNYAFLIDVFADVIREFPKACLILVGFGEEEKSLRLQAERTGIAEAVIFKTGTSAEGYYPLFDCFVLPSKQEGLSIALLEAMSFALPAIVATQGTEHEVIHHQINGFLTVCNDKRPWLEYVRILYTQPKTRLMMGERAYKTVSTEFGIERFAQEYNLLFSND